MEEEDDEKHYENEQNISELHIQHESELGESNVKYNKDSKANVDTSENECKLVF